MKVSIHLSKATGLAGTRKQVVIDDLELNTALSISAALNGLERSDVESLIVVRGPRRPQGLAALWRGVPTMMARIQRRFKPRPSLVPALPR